MTQLGPFYMGQVPLLPLVIAVTADDGSPTDLSAYSDLVLRLFRPDGSEADTVIGGGLEVEPADSSRVVYSWPDASLFTQPGQWKAQLQLTGPGTVNDFSVPIIFDVLLIGE